MGFLPRAGHAFQPFSLLHNIRESMAMSKERGNSDFSLLKTTNTGSEIQKSWHAGYKLSHLICIGKTYLRF